MNTANAEAPAIELCNVCTRSARGAQQLHDINLHVPRGSVYVVVGYHHSGKTSTLKAMCGLRAPSSGEVLIFGVPATTQLRERIAYAPQRPVLLPSMTLKDILTAKGIALGITNPREAAKKAAATCGLTNLKIRGKNANAEERRLLVIALALVGSPDVLLLDEPLLGLDGRTGCKLEAMLRELHDLQNMTIVIATPDPERFAGIATHFASIDQGGVLCELSSTRMHELCRKSIRVQTTHCAQDLAALEAELAGAEIQTHLSRQNGRPFLEIIGASREEVGYALHHIGATVLDMRRIHRSMDEALFGGKAEDIQGGAQ